MAGQGQWWRLHGLTIFGSLLVAIGSSATSNINRGSATWYGNLHGDGSDGGGCGYGKLVDAYGYIGRDTAVSDFLFQQGRGCGSCFKVKCVDPQICNNTWITVVVTDECPGGGNYCTNSNPHFDLSGSAIDRLSDRADVLRGGGLFPVAWKRTSCTYDNQNIVFRVMPGSTGYWFSVLVAYVKGDGDVGSMKLREANSRTWLDMAPLWGAVWCVRPVNSQQPLKGPFSIKLTGRWTGKTLTAKNVIPRNWEHLAASKHTAYISNTNFETTHR